jgi:2-hydroxy-3-oxopropionate reductase
MKLGIIGMGVMGLPIARNLVAKSGLPVLGYDVAETQRAKFEAFGGQAAPSPEDIYRQCGVVFFSLPSNQLVSAYLTAAAAHCPRGTVLVDLSSSTPTVIRAVAQAAEDAGVGLVDCPVSGGEAGASAGTLSAMCGGKPEDVAAVRPYLELFNSKVTYMGALGCGYAAKLANNMIIGVGIAAVAEAFAYARQAGLDERVLFEAIRDGGAGSAVLEVKGPKMLSRDYTASSRLSIHLKDQHNALLLAEDIGAYTPMTALATALMETLERDGRGGEDVAALMDLFTAGPEGAPHRATHHSEEP